MTEHKTKPGPKNDITDVPGIAVGQSEDASVNTGVTVVLPESARVCACDVRGGGPGTRETDLLNPSTLVDKADAVVLSGGSSYGLGAADGVTAWLGGVRKQGFSLVQAPGVPPSPIVPAAILYDLANDGDKNWGEMAPYRQLGRRACECAGAPLLQGRAGAGFGALAGDGVGGLGSASYVSADGLAIGALVAVNSFGSVKMPGTNAFWAWAWEEGTEFGGRRPDPKWRPVADMPPDTKLGAAAPRQNTTIGVVAVSASLTQAQAQRIAVMAQDGIARAIRPVHGPTDGDALFVLANNDGPTPDPMMLTRIGLLAADCVARAIARGVFEAENHGQK